MSRLKVTGVARDFVNDTRVARVLREISFGVGAGEVVALFGPNGCGKSTLLRILARLDSGYTGTLQLGDRPYHIANIGYVFQNFTASLFPWLTLHENIAFPRELRDGPGATGLAAESPDQILKRFGLEDFRNHYPYEVSGGMQQRVCFARTVGLKQDLLLLDEPFSALDTGGFAQLLDTFEGMGAAQRAPTILICHDLDQAMVFADRVLVLSPRPASIIEDIAIPFPRPRRPGLLLDADFQKLRSRIMEIRLRSEISGVPNPIPSADLSLPLS